MDLKKLFKNNDAVSPVIGVILMVAITVILAAAIGSSVFGQGTTNPAPKANINIKAVDAYASASSPATVTFEHNGGDPIHFEDSAITKVMASINGENSTDLTATSLGVMSTGSAKNLDLYNGTAAVDVPAGSTVNFKVVDVKTNQLIINKDVRF
jgi:archaeal type IV pilus assembly protein PilA